MFEKIKMKLFPNMFPGIQKWNKIESAIRNTLPYCSTNMYKDTIWFDPDAQDILDGRTYVHHHKGVAVQYAENELGEYNSFIIVLLKQKIEKIDWINNQKLKEDEERIYIELTSFEKVYISSRFNALVKDIHHAEEQAKKDRQEAELRNKMNKKMSYKQTMEEKFREYFV